MKKLDLPIFSLIFFLVFLISPQKTNAALVTGPEYYSSASQVPYSTGCTFPCGSLTTICWNNATVGGQNDCGTSCTPGQGSQTWTMYNLYQVGCFENYSIDPSGGACTPVYVSGSNACSTADKYNLSSYPSGGDTTLARAGDCACNAGGIYKTCCNGSTPAQTYISDGNPNFPDAGCAAPNKFVPCGPDPAIYAAMGYPFTNVACGTAACATPSPSLPPSQARYGCSNGSCLQDNINGQWTDPNCGGTCNTSCPSYAPPPTTTSGSCPAGTTCIAQQPSQTVQTSCTPTGSQCSPACSFTCRDSVGNTCPATTCSTVWACQGTQWFNGGQYYYTCPASCPSCPVGSTQTVCGTTQNTCHVPGT